MHWQIWRLWAEGTCTSRRPGERSCAFLPNWARLSRTSTFVPNAQYQRCDDSDCGCSLPPRCAGDVPTTIAVAAIWENHAHGNARLLLLSRVCPADQCGMARETKVTVAWPSRNILRPKSPAQRALITALPAYASEYQVGILVKCPPATSSHSPSQPPFPLPTTTAAINPPPHPPSATLTLPVCRASAAGIAHHHLPAGGFT
jgi:hypothetical protein